ncbi:hypothetical protein JCM5296_005948 [Sporobolomyces johnsonii]
MQHSASVNDEALEPSAGCPLFVRSLVHIVTLAPYATSYIPPSDLAGNGGPVAITLALGEAEVEEEIMEWEEVVPDPQDVLDAVRNLREHNGMAAMQVDTPWELTGEGADGAGAVVVVDTNILISHLPLLRSLTELCASASPLLSSRRPTLLIPHIVLRELDGLKTSSRSADTPVNLASHEGLPRRAQASVAILARAATNWLLSALPSSSAPLVDTAPSIVRGQRRSETLLPKHAPGENNDSLVLDAALYFRQRGETGQRVVLLSDDNNLRLRAKFEDVETMGVSDKLDAAHFLEQLDPAFARSLSTPSEPSSCSTSIPATPLPPPNSLRRSPPAPIALPSTLARSTSMDLDLDPPTPPPMDIACSAPTLHPLLDRSSVFRNLCILATHFLALPLYRHIFKHLEKTQPGTQRVWQTELGDWRLWEAADATRAAKRWWDEGDVKEVCRRGLAKMDSRAAPVTPRSLPASPPATAVAPSGRDTTSSRWANGPSHSSPSPRPLPPAPPRSPPRRSSSSCPVPLSVRLSDLHRSFDVLTTTFASPAESTRTWSAPRFEVLLEGTSRLLVAVLGGLVDGDVDKEVDTLLTSWVADLRRFGIDVEVSLR